MSKRQVAHAAGALHRGTLYVSGETVGTYETASRFSENTQILKLCIVYYLEILSVSERWLTHGSTKNMESKNRAGQGTLLW